MRKRFVAWINRLSWKKALAVMITEAVIYSAVVAVSVVSLIAMTVVGAILVSKLFAIAVALIAALLSYMLTGNAVGMWQEICNNYTLYKEFPELWGDR